MALVILEGSANSLCPLLSQSATSEETLFTNEPIVSEAKGDSAAETPFSQNFSAGDFSQG